MTILVFDTFFKIFILEVFFGARNFSLSLGFFTNLIFWATFVGFLAKRKGLNLLVWSIIGALFSLLALIPLSFMSFRCKKCGEKISKKENKQGACSNCDHKKDLEKTN